MYRCPPHAGSLSGTPPCPIRGTTNHICVRERPFSRHLRLRLVHTCAANARMSDSTRSGHPWVAAVAVPRATGVSVAALGMNRVRSRCAYSGTHSETDPSVAPGVRLAIPVENAHPDVVYYRSRRILGRISRSPGVAPTRVRDSGCVFRVSCLRGSSEASAQLNPATDEVSASEWLAVRELKGDFDASGLLEADR